MKINTERKVINIEEHPDYIGLQEPIESTVPSSLEEKVRNCPVNQLRELGFHITSPLNPFGMLKRIIKRRENKKDILLSGHDDKSVLLVKTKQGYAAYFRYYNKDGKFTGYLPKKYHIKHNKEEKLRFIADVYHHLFSYSTSQNP